MLGLVLVGCASEPSSQTYPDDCAPVTCAGVGVACGAVPDGCGGTLDCGTCGPDDHTGCIPKTCAETACGQVDNGCGVALDCGTCDSSEGCVANRCVQTECGAAGDNACGGCGPLPVEPGHMCPCGATATCTAWGDISCGGSTTKALLPTDDANDAFLAVAGNLEAEFAGGGLSHNFDAETARYTVFVDDTVWGVLSPEFEYTGPAGIGVTVCAEISPYDGLAKCSDETASSTAHGCCKRLPPGSNTLAFGLTLNNGYVDPFDNDLHVAVSITPDAAQANANGVCAPYTLRYRF